MINENDELQAERQTQSAQLADKDKRIAELQKELDDARMHACVPNGMGRKCEFIHEW